MGLFVDPSSPFYNENLVRQVINMNGYDHMLFVNREKKFKGFQKLLLPATRQAVMSIEAPKDMGKSWLINRMRHHCAEPDVNIPVAQIDFRNPREIHELQDVLGLIRLLRNKLNAPAHFAYLNEVVNRFTQSVNGRLPQLSTLRRNMETYFNLEDLRGLAFDLRINYDNLRGEILTAKVQALLLYCEQNGRFPDLIARCKQLRPHVIWEIPKPMQSSETAVADDNAPIWADSDQERQRAYRQINDAFFQCLAALLEEQTAVVFLFDSYEQASPEMDAWLRQELLPRLRDGEIADIVIIIAGRKTPDFSDLNADHLIVPASLIAFSERYIKEYFVERRKLTDPDIDIRTILLASGGIPGAMAMMADRIMAAATEDDDFFSDL